MNEPRQIRIKNRPPARHYVNIESYTWRGQRVLVREEVHNNPDFSGLVYSAKRVLRFETAPEEDDGTWTTHNYTVMPKKYHKKFRAYSRADKMVFEK